MGLDLIPVFRYNTCQLCSMIWSIDCVAFDFIYFLTKTDYLNVPSGAHNHLFLHELSLRSNVRLQDFIYQ